MKFMSILEKKDFPARSYQILCRRYGKTDYRKCWQCGDYQKLRLVNHRGNVSEEDLNSQFFSLLSQSVQNGNEGLLWDPVRCNRLLTMWTAWEGPIIFDDKSSLDIQHNHSTGKLLNLGQYKEIESFVVSATHWDPEVHQPTPVMSIRLVSIVEDLLKYLYETPDCPPFIFDGQVSPIYDYLCLFPEKEKSVKRLVSEHKLIVGPWWIIPDTYHPTGEGLIRNLLLGRNYSLQLGNVMKAGYTPDPFGMIAQLPQILAGFELNSCFTRRGIGNEPIGNEFLWVSPDGSSVLGVHLRWGYRTIGLLPRKTDIILAAVGEVIEEMAQSTCSPNILLMSGDNNLGVQKDLPGIVNILEQKIENVSFKFGTLEDFAKRVQESNPNLHPITGELIGGRYQMHLTGCASTRIPMKQMARKVSACLEDYAEKLAAIAWCNGFIYPKTYLDKAWELVIRNTFHDAISGTHVDSVDETIQYRSMQALDIAKTIGEQSLHHLVSCTACSEGNSLFIFENALPSTSIPIEVNFPRPISNLQGYLDCNGNFEQFQFTDQEHSRGIFLHSRKGAGKIIGHQVLKPVLEKKSFATEPIKISGFQGRTLSVTFKIEPNGISILKNNSSDMNLRFGMFKSYGDRGDLFRPWLLEEDVKEGLTNAKIKLIEKGVVRCTYLITGKMSLPISLSSNRANRSARRVNQTVSMQVSLYHKSPLIDIIIDIENRARDHLFQFGLIFDQIYPKVGASQSFYIHEIPLPMPASFEDWIEQPSISHFTSGMITIGDWTILTPDVMDFVPIANQTQHQTEIWLNLLRGVGIHGLKSTPQRLWNAGMPSGVPNAQCIGHHQYRIRILPETSADGEKWEMLRILQSPIPAFLMDEQDGWLGEDNTYFQIEPADAVVSAIKCSEDGDHLILRLFNASREEIPEAVVISQLSIHGAWSSNLAEVPSYELEVHDAHSVRFPMRPHEIKTIRFKTSAFKSRI